MSVPLFSSQPECEGPGSPVCPICQRAPGWLGPKPPPVSFWTSKAIGRPGVSTCRHCGVALRVQLTKLGQIFQPQTLAAMTAGFTISAAGNTWWALSYVVLALLLVFAVAVVFSRRGRVYRLWLAEPEREPLNPDLSA